MKGVFLANQKVDGKVVTLITYNKGRDWGHLRPPSEDMNGKPTNCKPVSVSAHVPHLWRGAKHSKVTDSDVHAGPSDGQEPRDLGAVGRVTGSPSLCRRLSWRSEWEGHPLAPATTLLGNRAPPNNRRVAGQPGAAHTSAGADVGVLLAMSSVRHPPQNQPWPHLRAGAEGSRDVASLLS